MRVTIELTPEEEAHILTQAERAGVSLETYVRSLVAEAATLPAHGVKTISPPPSTQEEFEAFLDAMAEGGEDLPVLSDEDLTREVIYGDRD